MPRFSLPLGDMKFDETFGEDAKTHSDLNQEERIMVNQTSQ